MFSTLVPTLALIRALHDLLQHDRIDRRADRARDRQRRRAEQELIHVVLCAVVRQILQVKNLAHRDAYHRNHYPMPRLERFGAFVWAHFAAPGVEADRRDLFAMYPLGGFEPQPRRVACRVSAPVAAREAMFHLAGAHDQEITGPHFDALRFRARIELVVAYAVTVFEIVAV